LIPERLSKCLRKAYGWMPPASQHGRILEELSFTNDEVGIRNLLSSASRYGSARAVVESTGNMWIRIHDTLEENGIETVLAHPIKTRLIAEAKIKSDRLDSRMQFQKRRAHQEKL